MFNNYPEYAVGDNVFICDWEHEVIIATNINSIMVKSEGFPIYFTNYNSRQCGPMELYPNFGVARESMTRHLTHNK